MLPHEWTDLTRVQRAAAILHVYETGMTAKQIADRLGRDITRNQIARTYLDVDWLKTEAPLGNKGLNPAWKPWYEPKVYPRHFTQEEADLYDSTSLKMTLMDLAPSGDCRFPTGRDPIVFCGHNTKRGSQYCEHHHIRCWAPAPKPITTKKAYR